MLLPATIGNTAISVVGIIDMVMLNVCDNETMATAEL